MPYYQTLKHRRESLHLSIENVSAQTRLKPEFIRAIEEHNLDLFSDDFSYVRYFIHAYCDAIGVNWDMIRKEVDEDVSRSAQARDQALYQAQIQMIETMPQAKSTKATVRKGKRRRKKSFLERSAGSLSRKLSWGGKKISKGMILLIVAAVAGLFALSAYQNSVAQKAYAARAKQMEEERLAKEEETQRLAQDLQSKRSSDAQPESEKPTLRISSLESENTYRVEGILSSQPQVQVQFYAVGSQTVTITWNGAPAFSQVVSGEYTYTLQAGQSGTLSVVFSGPSVYNWLRIDGSEIPADYTLYSQSGGNRIDLDLIFSGTPEPADSTQSSDETVPESQPLTDPAGQDLNTPYVEDAYDAPIDENGYYTDPNAYDPNVYGDGTEIYGDTDGAEALQYLQ